MTDRVQRLKQAIEAKHGCKASHTDTVPIVEMFGVKVVWEGMVTVFEIEGHPQATRCYAWGCTDEADGEFVSMLELPPVFSARDAVRASMIADIKSGKFGVPAS